MVSSRYDSLIDMAVYGRYLHDGMCTNGFLVHGMLITQSKNRLCFLLPQWGMFEKDVLAMKEIM